MLVDGVRLVPDPSGALWWPDQRLLAVADLHLEKGSAFARRGVPLPPYDSRTAIARLEALMRRYTPRRVVCLGDSFHDDDGPARLNGDDAARLRRMIGSTDWIWIAGNHDAAPAHDFGGRIQDDHVESGLTFRHIASATPVRGEVSGHYHPKATVAVRGTRITRACFLTDGVRLILPAFGAYAGGLDVRDPAFEPLFRRRFQAWMLGDGRVFPVPSHRIFEKERDVELRSGSRRPGRSATD